MTEYIEREAAVKAFCEQCRDYADGKCTYEGACEVNIIATVPTADVKPASVIKELQEHIKQRILETAFNNGGIYGEVAEDIANRIDIWVDEFGRTEND